jgi:hypothetical protein
MPICAEEILKAIKEMKCNKACAENQIVNEYIKHSASKLVNVYVQFFNIVFDTGILPDIWLKGNIIPIYKNSYL